MICEHITGQVLNAFYKVYNVLGYGFLEKVYESALVIELENFGLNISRQRPITVYYRGHIVGEYFADIVVNDLVILELKAAEWLSNDHYAQLGNYLKATDKEVGLLLNFGRKPEFKRILFTNDQK